MLITIIIILLLIGAAVVGSIYSNFLVFYSNFSESTNYHKAYYAAISALERAELVTKQRLPGFYGCGGRKSYGNDDCPIRTESSSDSKPSSSSFSYLSDNDSNVFRTINSRTTRIPSTTERGDVEPLLAAPDSTGYNMMDYENTQIFLLYYDDGINSYTKASTYTNSSTSKIQGHIRLPQFLQTNFSDLDINHSLVEGGSNPQKNDVIIDWQIRGKYGGKTFTTYSIQSNNSNDTAFRENDINNTHTQVSPGLPSTTSANPGLYFLFGKNSRSPIFYSDTSRPSSPSRGKKDTFPITISENEDSINSNSDKFGNIFSNSDQGQLRFSLVNLLKSNGGMIYPFLEYYVEFKDRSGNPAEVSDKYYTINAEGYYGEYKINKKVWKPTVKESVLSSFTSIFN